MHKTILKSTLAALVFGGLTSAARAGVEVNGSFEQTFGSPSGGQLGYNIFVSSWTPSGVDYLFTPGSLTTGVPAAAGTVTLSGPGTGVPNGLSTSPDGGNLIGAESGGSLSQTINGLSIGSQYTVSFEYAGAQKSGNFGPTSQQWDVSFGGQTQDSSLLANASQGFTGWNLTSLTFTADASSEVLSFYATAFPDTLGSVTLLDGISVINVTAVPEPSMLALAGMGAAGLLVRRFRNRK